MKVILTLFEFKNSFIVLFLFKGEITLVFYINKGFQSYKTEFIADFMFPYVR